MKSPPSSSAGHNLLGISAIVAAILMLASAPIVAYRALKAEIAEIDVKSAVLERMTASITAARDLLRAPATDGQFAADFLGEGAEPVIVAELQNKLRTEAQSMAVEWSTSSNLPSKPQNGLTFVGFRVVLRGQIGDVQRLIHRIETSQPLLFVERLSLRPDARPMVGRDPSLSHIPPLLAELDIYGARLPNPSTSGEPTTLPKGRP